MLSCLRESSGQWFSSRNYIDLVALISSSKSFLLEQDGLRYQIKLVGYR